VAAYVPSAPWIVAAVAAALAAVLLGGFAVTRFLAPRAARAAAWTMAVAGTVGMERLCAREAPGLRMLALIGAALLAMKAVVLAEERARGGRSLSFTRWLGFAAAWPGMQPRLFAAAPAPPLPGGWPLVGRGLARLALGAALVLLARPCWSSLRSRLAASVFLLAGLSFLLHFGLCNLLAGLWRLGGVACDPLFRAPWRSQSLGEFWARRWNLAFSHMTSAAVYRPLVPRVGRAPALLGGFALSGLLHEMAISLPVRAGFGGPLLYFVLQARNGRPLAGWAGRAWAILWLLAPLPLLFHRPFLAGVVWPLVGIPPAGP
jgi:alginate O-acetyltransferase complex protein AlgI